MLRAPITIGDPQYEIFHTFWGLGAEMTFRIIRNPLTGPKVTPGWYDGLKGRSCLPNPLMHTLSRVRPFLWLEQTFTPLDPSDIDPITGKTPDEVEEEAADTGGLGLCRGHNFVNEAPSGFMTAAQLAKVMKRPKYIAVMFHISLSDSDPERIDNMLATLRYDVAALRQEAGGMEFNVYDHTMSGTLTITLDFVIAMELDSNDAIRRAITRFTPPERGNTHVDREFLQSLRPRTGSARALKNLFFPPRTDSAVAFGTSSNPARASSPFNVASIRGLLTRRN